MLLRFEKLILDKPLYFILVYLANFVYSIILYTRQKKKKLHWRLIKQNHKKYSRLKLLTWIIYPSNLRICKIIENNVPLFSKFKQISNCSKSYLFIDGIGLSFWSLMYQTLLLPKGRIKKLKKGHVSQCPAFAKVKENKILECWQQKRLKCRLQIISMSQEWILQG